MQEFKNHRAAILRMRICPTLFPRARVTDARSGRLALCEVSDRRLLRAEIELCFFVVFTVMFAVYPLLLLRSIATTSWSGLRMSRRAGRLRGRAADANVSCSKLSGNLLIIVFAYFVTTGAKYRQQ